MDARRGPFEEFAIATAVLTRLPAGIEVDVSGLDIGDQITVADLALPPGVVSTQEPGDLVAHVTQPRGLDLPEEAEVAEGEEGEGEGEAAAGEAGEGASASAEEE